MTQAAVNNAIVLYQLQVKREDVERAQEIYFLTPMLQKALLDPTIPLEKKYSVIEKVFTGSKLPKTMIDFVKMMCKLRNVGDMKDIFDAYYSYWDAQNHILHAEFVSAKEPKDEEIERAIKLLQNKYPNEKIEMTQSIDESLLGGFVIKTHNKEYDRSFEGRLRQLERKLTGR